MAEFRLTPPNDPNAMGSLYGMPQDAMWLQSGMMQVPGSPQFPLPPPSRMDAAYAQSVARLGGMAEAAQNDPASVAQNFGGPGLAASAVIRALQNSDRSGQRGMQPLGGPRRQDVAIPDAAQLTAGQEPAPAPDILGQLMTQRTALQAEIAKATAERDKQSKTGAGPRWQTAVDTANGLISDMKSLNAQITAEQDKQKEMLRRSSPEYQRMLTEGDKAATARDAALGNMREGYEKDAPLWLQKAQAFLPMATPAVLHAGFEAAKVLKNRTAAGQWVNAIEAANASQGPERTAAAGLSGQFAKEYPKPGMIDNAKKFGATAGAGAVEGAALSNIPEAYNLFLPAYNQERQAWENYLKALPSGHPDRERAQQLLEQMPTSNPVRDSAVEHFASRSFPVRLMEGAMEGGAGALTGKGVVGAFNPAFPRPQAAALKSEVAKEARAAKEAQIAEEAAAAQAAAEKAARAAKRSGSKKSVAEALIDPPAQVPDLGMPTTQLGRMPFSSDPKLRQVPIGYTSAQIQSMGPIEYAEFIQKLHAPPPLLALPPPPALPAPAPAGPNRLIEDIMRRYARPGGYGPAE